MTDTAEIPEDIKALADECLPKHVQVVQAILSGDYSSNTASYMAFYPDSSRDAASTGVQRMLKIATVRALYNALREAQFMDGVMSRGEAMQKLSSMARVSLADLVDFTTQTHTDDEGEEKTYSTWQFKDSADLSPEALAAIQELSSSKEGHKIKIHDAKAAIKQLAEMAGWNEAQKLDVTHKGGITHIESEYVDPKD